MRSKLRRDIGLLKGYAAVSSLALLVVSVAAFRQATPSVPESTRAGGLVRWPGQHPVPG